MILIISYSGGSVNKVMDWLDSRDVKFHRLNPYLDKVKIRLIELSQKECDIELELEGYGVTTRLSDYKGIWIWHSNLWFENCRYTIPIEEEGALKSIRNSLDNHHSILISFFSEFINHLESNVIGNYNAQDLNKLTVLLKARSLGISIPDSYIISSKQQIYDILEKTPLITKPYHEVAYVEHEGITYQNYTSSVEVENLENINSVFFPTLVQDKIEKIFEIRTFFLKGNFYSMAIFSQSSEKTKVDFRNYNFDKPNRSIPFELPLDQEDKLRQLFAALNLNSGSVDLIYTKDNQFIFLEINPIGQFGMVSFPCNYYLERKIMEELIK